MVSSRSNVLQSKTLRKAAWIALWCCACAGDRKKFGETDDSAQGSSGSKPSEDASAQTVTQRADASVPGSESPPDAATPSEPGQPSSSAPTADAAPMGTPSEPGENGCASEQLRCSSDGTAVEQCSTGGQWLVRMSCPESEPVCWQGECLECMPGARTCGPDNALLLCSSTGQWTVEETCAEGTECLQSTLSCGTCVDEDRQCQDDSTLEVCSGGRFVAEPCAGDTPFCEAGRCVACSANSQPTCESNSVVSCEDGQWSTQAECSGATPVCNAQTGACAECAPADQVCVDGELAACDELGQWQFSDCEAETPVCLADECVACDPETATARCRNNAVEVCSAQGEWQVSESCAADQVCLEALGTCGTCEEGYQQCNDSGTAVATCNNSGQLEEEPCPANTPVCSDSECVACAEGTGPQKKCVGNTPQICASNAWVSQAPCSEETPECDATTGECVCQDEAFKCQGNTLQQCTAGEWVTVTTCSGEYALCDEDQGRCVCDEGDAKCVVGVEDSVMQCEGGWWVEELCPSQGPVCYDGECSECIPGNPPECQEPEWDGLAYTGGQTRISCTSAAQVQEQVCPFLCNAGECVDTRDVAGSYTCDVQFGVLCTSPQICCGARQPSCVTDEADCGAASPGSSFSANRFRCDDHSDCASGQICCHHITGGTAADVIECETPANCADTDTYMGYYDRVVCSPNDPCEQGTCTAFGETGISHCVL